MKVKSFNEEEDLELRRVSGDGHSHIELWQGSVRLGYMHIDSDKIHWCSRLTPSVVDQWIYLKKLPEHPAKTK